MPTLADTVAAAPFVVVDAHGRGPARFAAPVRLIEAHSLDDVLPAIADAENAAIAGHFVAGFVAYEAAGAFDPALVTHPADELPLVWFAVFDGDAEPVPGAAAAAPPPLAWSPSIDAAAYRDAVARIRDWIAAGDTYQVNYTFPLRAPFSGYALAYYQALAAAQPTEFAAYLDLGRFAIASVSPELFFRLDGDHIVMRPMKGTAARGLWPADDASRSEAMKASSKERAENLMIVDMVRNDLGRIARTGSVTVASLFDTERHPTVWQMTSKIEAQTRAPLPEIFRALFPSASVTGAPKVRTMQIIRELEAAPRGAYCGAIGWMGPGRRAQFGVGIRTVTVDRASGLATYHVGSGVTWDSIADGEFDECRLKAEVLRFHRPSFDLLESLKWDSEYLFLEAHVARLRASAEFFGFPWDEAAVRAALDRVAQACPGAAKIRLLLGADGRPRTEAQPLPPTSLVRVALAETPVDSSDVFLYHKTTRRDVFDRARAQRPGCDDVILWNERGELTESTVANLVVRRGGTWYTPPVDAGLLGGVMRAELLRTGKIHEMALKLSEVFDSDEVALINSVRGWIPAVLVEPAASRVATA